MSYSWVRRTRTIGDWAKRPVTIELSASPLATVGYFTVTALTLGLIVVPIGAAASSGLETTEISTIGALRLVIAALLAVAATAWFAYCCYRSAMVRPTVTIRATIVETATPGLFTTKITHTPISAFDGVAILPRSSLNGREFGIYLLHPDRDRNSLVHIDTGLVEPVAAEIAGSLGLPLIGSRQAEMVRLPSFATAA